MTPDHTTTLASPRWLHALAVLTVLLTLPLLFLGAGVTSHGVGMVDPRGFRWPWEIVRGLFDDNGFGWLLEYSHRTVAYLVGFCAILLAIGCWFYDRRPWMGWLGILALGVICIQGALGALRVNFNALHGSTFAMIHGMFAQVVVAVLFSVALFTSSRWLTDRSEPASPALRRCSSITAIVVFGQLLLGGLVRHQPDSLLGPRGHLLGAFVVVGGVLWLLLFIRADEFGARFKMQRIALMALLTLQLLLGVESWLAKFYVPQADLPQLAPLPMHAEWIRTAHYLAGTLIFSTTVVIALIAHRNPAAGAAATSVRSHELEGAL